jgi:hypothetical protein
MEYLVKCTVGSDFMGSSDFPCNRILRSNRTVASENAFYSRQSTGPEDWTTKPEVSCDSFSDKANPTPHPLP